MGIVSEYLPQELADSLAAKLNLPEPEKPAAKRQSEGRPGGNEPPNKKIKHEGKSGIIQVFCLMTTTALPPLFMVNIESIRWEVFFSYIQ